MHLGARWLILLVASVTLACKSSSSYCPGLCTVENLFPTMTAETADGRASIATAKIVSGPCVQLLEHSAGDAGSIDGYEAVQVTYNGPIEGATPLCLLEITSIYGETTVVRGDVVVSEYQQSCCPYDRCCSQPDALSLHHRVEFSKPSQTVSLWVPLDGGMSEAYDASQSVDADRLDAGAVDSELTDGGQVDAASIDSPAVDAQIDEANDDDVPAEP